MLRATSKAKTFDILFIPQTVTAGNGRLYVGWFVLSMTVVVGVSAVQFQDIQSNTTAVIKAKKVKIIQIHRSNGW